MSRKIDALIAEHIMGHEVKRPHPDVMFMYPDKAHSAENIPYYSTDIAAAWEVVEKMVTEGRGFNQWYKVNEDGKRVWKVLMELHGVNYEVSHESAPMAFCLLALKAKGIEEGGSE